MSVFDLSYVAHSSAKCLEKAYNKSGLCDTPITYERIEKGVILPFVIGGLFDAMGGVVRKDGSFVKSSAFDWRMHGDYPYNCTQESDEKVIFIASIHRCWGHVITDAIKRLWFIHTDEYKALEANGYRLAYISYPDIRGREYDYIRRVFQLCGADISKMIYISQPSRFNEVIVPDCCYIQYPDHDCCTMEFVRLIDRMKANIRIDKFVQCPHKIYLTRSRLKSSKDYGEKDVETLFNSKGYHIVAPEVIDVDTQIYMMMQAKEIATTEGSIAHTLMFANPECRCTVLRKANYVNKYQLLIAKVFLQHFTYIDANHSVYANGNRKEDGPFFLFPTPQLTNYLNIHQKKKHLLSSRSFWKYLLCNNPILLHLRNFYIFITAPTSTKTTIIKNKLHFLKYR